MKQLNIFLTILASLPLTLTLTCMDKFTQEQIEFGKDVLTNLGKNPPTYTIPKFSKEKIKNFLIKFSNDENLIHISKKFNEELPSFFKTLINILNHTNNDNYDNSSDIEKIQNSKQKIEQIISDVPELKDLITTYNELNETEQKLKNILKLHTACNLLTPQEQQDKLLKIGNSSINSTLKLLENFSNELNKELNNEDTNYMIIDISTNNNDNNDITDLNLQEFKEISGNTLRNFNEIKEESLTSYRNLLKSIKNTDETTKNGYITWLETYNDLIGLEKIKKEMNIQDIILNIISKN